MTGFDEQRASGLSRKAGHIRNAERPVSQCYPVIDSDIARDNIENDIPEADLQDL